LPSTPATLPLHQPQPTPPTTTTRSSAHPKHTAVKTDTDNKLFAAS
jgi:hypothetical protein